MFAVVKNGLALFFAPALLSKTNEEPNRVMAARTEIAIKKLCRDAFAGVGEFTRSI